MGWFNDVVLAEDIADNDSSSKKKYTEKDASKETNSSNKEVAKAWHDARDDAEEDGEITRSR